MPKQFRRDGVQFSYPDNWHVDTEESDEGWTATVQSPRTAFAVVTLRRDAEDPGHVVRQVLEAYTSDYPELESSEAVDTLAGRPAVGVDLDFLTVDVAVVGRIRCITTSEGSLLFVSQVAEFDRELNEVVLDAVEASLLVEDE